MSYRLAGEAARLVGQRALEDLVYPCGGRRRAVALLRIKRAVGQFAVLLVLLLLLLQQVGYSVEQVVEELMRILLHVVIKELCSTEYTLVNST